MGFVPAGALAIGNSIVTRAGPALVVKAVKWNHRAQGYDVYNFVVEDDHTYFVGKAHGGAWVHNIECNGQFSVIDWSGYPEGGPRPAGPFRLLEGTEYQEARAAANAANGKLHSSYPEFGGYDLHEWHPIKMGGSPTAINNKYPLSRAEHKPYTDFWNGIRDFAKGIRR